jgi:hypothetical protein
MLKRSISLPAGKKVGSNKLVLGFAALAATAVVGTTGIAAAAQNGSGYGGGNTNSINLDFDVSGDHNVVHVILNFFQ